MTVRALAAALTLVVGLLAAGLIVEDPGILATLAGKVAEGGMWTAVAVFIVVAAVLGYRRRDGAGRAPPDPR